MSSAALTVQQQLFKCCHEPLDENDDKLSSLKSILDQLKQQNKKYLINVEDVTHRAPLFHAIESGKPLEFLKELLCFPAAITNRILVGAIRHGNLDIIKLLHQHGADFKETFYGISLLHECVLLHKNHFISFLIEKGGINPNVLDHDNQSPLLYAIFRTNVEAINILLSHSSIDPCLISTRKQQLTTFHVACELGIDEVLPTMMKSISVSNINKLSYVDQTPFDLFLCCYLFTKNDLYMNEIGLEKFSSLFDLFLLNNAKLHHLTKAYRRTRAPFVTKILTILFKKNISFYDVMLDTGRSTLFTDLQSLVCQSLGDWTYLVESNDNIKTKQRQLILRQLYELFICVHYKSINAQQINKKLLTRYCSASEKDSKIKQVLWLFIKNFIEPNKNAGSLKSICRTKILLNINSIDKHCTTTDLGTSKDLENYLLFFTMI